MGNISRTITSGVTDYLVKSASYPLSEGIIYAVALSHCPGNSSPNDCFAEFGLTDTIDSQAAIAAVLLNGYFTPQARLGWTGRQPIVSEMFLYVNIYAPANTAFHLSWLQLMPSADKSSKEVLDA